jgi:2-iminoacetate synthase
MSSSMTAPKAMAWHKRRLQQIREWQSSRRFPDFIDESAIEQVLVENRSPSRQAVLDIVQKARDHATTGELLSPAEVALLAHVEEPDLWEAIFEAADWIKRTVYGNRIVLFAPLYVSSSCVNNCKYCGFRTANTAVARRNLTSSELREEVRTLVSMGHKRLIMVYGESEDSDYRYICETVSAAYSVKEGFGEIRRANINASPLSVEEYGAVKSVGIGTYQVFQETYHRPTYRAVHPEGTLKGEYDWRLFSLHRAQEAGIDDIAIGVLFGLYDWRFELLGLLHHAMALEREFGVGPHTISYPRLEPAKNTPLATESPWLVSDEDFAKIVAIVRLMCPYTGSILTAREPAELRRKTIGGGGVSQMDAGSRIAVGGYSRMHEAHQPDRQQFLLSDTRTLDEFIHDLCRDGYLPSFCTAGYREGRTGAVFMPLAKHATVKNFCIANGILSFEEYLQDYASPQVREIGQQIVIPKYLKWLEENVPALSEKVHLNLCRVREEKQRDLHF